jgi:dihydrofolate reductase
MTDLGRLGGSTRPRSVLEDGEYSTSSKPTRGKLAGGPAAGARGAAELTHRLETGVVELQVHGSGALVRWLLENDLVDEITLLTYPVIIGQGTRLFAGTGPDTGLELVESRSTSSGVTIQVYRPTGRPQYATAAPDVNR